MYKLPKGSRIRRSSSNFDSSKFGWTWFVTTRDAHYVNSDVNVHDVNCGTIILSIPLTDGFDEICVYWTDLDYYETVS